MRVALLAAVVLGLGLAVAAVALPRGPGVPEAPSAPAAETGRSERFALRTVADGLVRPTWVGAAPGDANALWIAEQPGRVLRIGRGGARRTVLDLRRRVRLGAEQGLLGLAFHPDFAANRRLYVHFSERSRGDTRVVELRLDRALRRPVGRPRTLLAQRQPEENHNGGQLAFAPDGRLHLGLGDGGGARDPRDRAQAPGTLLGKLVALDVDRPRARWSVVLSGLRNPWRFSFDVTLNEVWIGDVGQDRFEEVHRVALEADEPPKNLGWPVYEGAEAVGADRRLDRAGELVFPVAGYDHDTGCSITGGVVYRGAALPGLTGRYVFGDFCSGALWTADPQPDGSVADVRRERAVAPELTHIGTDERGELVLATSGGTIQTAQVGVRRP